MFAPLLIALRRGEIPDQHHTPRGPRRLAFRDVRPVPRRLDPDELAGDRQARAAAPTAAEPSAPDRSHPFCTTVRSPRALVDGCPVLGKGHSAARSGINPLLEPYTEIPTPSQAGCWPSSPTSLPSAASSATFSFLQSPHRFHPPLTRLSSPSSLSSAPEMPTGFTRSGMRLHRTPR